MQTQKLEVELLHGRDIDYQITAHELARLLLEGPDHQVFVPDDVEADEHESFEFVGVGRVTFDSTYVYIGGYFAVDLKANKLAPDYEFADR